MDYDSIKMDYKSISNKFENLENNKVIQNFVAQANSRYLLFSVGELEDNFPNYTENLDSRCLSIAFNYLHIGLKLYYLERTSESVEAFEKAANILEYIYNYDKCELDLKENGRNVCGLSYYSGMQYSKSFIVLKRSEADTKISKLIKLFISKNFEELQTVILELAVVKDHAELVDSDFIYSSIFSRCLSYALDYVYCGDENSISQAMETIDDLIELTSIDNDPALWWVFKLFKIIIDGLRDNSLWNCLKPIENSIVHNYIKSNSYNQPPIIELFRSQRDSLELVFNMPSGVISVPTSSGKTKIAELAILKNIIEDPQCKCLYIAPFRSLAYEIEEVMLKMFSSIGINVTHLYGSSQFNNQDKLQIENANIIIATQEKAKAILRASDEVKENLKLVIIDEGHLIGAEERYITSELLIEEMRSYLDDNGGNLYILSAVLPNLAEFSEWIGGNEQSIIKTDWRPSTQRLGLLELVNNQVNLEWYGEEKSFNKRFIEPQLIRSKKVNKKSRKSTPAKYFPSNKKEAVAAVSTKLSEFGSVLIYVGRANMVKSQAREISKLIGANTHIWSNENDYTVFTMACEEAYGPNSDIQNYIDKGIVCHSAKLPFDVRISMEKLMRNGNPKFIIATSTLAQGVNIGVSSVIISNIWITQKDLLSVKDFWNIAGRAGRAFSDIEGKILFAVDKNNKGWQVERDMKFFKIYSDKFNIEEANSGVYFLLNAIYKIAAKCDVDFDYLVELISENNISKISEEINEFSSISSVDFIEKIDQLFDLIDDTLLSMSDKYESYLYQDPSYWIDDVFRRSLAVIEARKDNSFDEEALITLLKARNRGIIKEIADHEKWKLHTNNSVSLRISIELDKFIDEIVNSIEYINIAEISFENLTETVRYFDSILDTISSKGISSYLTDTIDESTLRKLWLSGTAVSEIESYNKKAMYICNNYYGFQFPWIVGAIAKKLRIKSFEEQADFVEFIIAAVELGLSNKKAIDLYVCGVRSRVSCTEISSKLPNDLELETIGVKNYILKYYDDLKELVSDNAGAWIHQVYKNSTNNVTRQFKGFSINLKNINDFIGIDFTIKKYNDDFYLVSKNAEKVKKVKFKNGDKIGRISDIHGLIFEWNEYSNNHTLISNNPHIEIL